MNTALKLMLEKKETTEAILEISHVFNQYFAATNFGQKAKDYSRMEWYILNFISLQPNTTEADLHKIIPADQTKIRRAIRKLGRARLIYRAENPEEEESILELTPKGVRECEEAEEIDVQIAKEILKNVPSESLKQFEDSLQQTLKILSPKRENIAVNS